jgi:lipocalin
MTIMTLFRSLRAWLAGSAFCVFSMVACAAPPHDAQAVTPHRLTVADFMGTWKVFARTPMGSDILFPSIKSLHESDIGKTIVFRNSSVIDNSYIFMGNKFTKNPKYSIKYIKIYPNTYYPELHGFYCPDYLYNAGYYTIFEVDDTSNQPLYSWFLVGSDNKSLSFALTLTEDGGAFFLCKVNPKTGQCQDHP